MYEKNAKMTYSKETIEEVLTYPCIRVPDHVPLEAAEYFEIRSAVSQTDGKTVEATYFPYYDQQNKLVGFKKRDWTKAKNEKFHFTTVGKVEATCKMFGQHKASANPKKIAVVEGECFTPETEVLTRDGWVSFEDYKGEDVFQINQDQTGNFITPIAKIEKEFEGELIEYKSGSYYSLTTPNHNLVRLNSKGELFKHPAINAKKKQYRVPRVVKDFYKGCLPTKQELNLARLRIMLSADFSFRKTGDLYGTFKKERKIERATKLLNELGVRYSSKIEPSSRKTNFFIHRGHGIEASKLFDWGWLYEASAPTLLEEILFWDGNSVPNRNQIEYASKELHNAKFVQTLAHLNGYTSTIIRRSNQWGSWYKVSILFGKQTSSTLQGYKKVPYKGKVMCVTVPSGMLLVRQKESISISGNCDTAVAWYTIQQHLKGLDKKYHPSFAIVSLPAGCGNAQASASANAKFLLSGQELILGLDNDERLPGEKKNVMRGKEGKEAMFSALLSDKIKELTWPVGHKDARDYATECLQQKKLKDFFDLVMYSPTNYNGSGVVKPNDIGYEEFIKPIPLGVMIPSLPKTMEKLMGIRKRELTMITGPSGCGKSTITAEVLHYLASEGYRTGIIFLEEIARKTLQRLAARYLEINYKDFKFDPSKAASEEDLKRAWDWISDEEADRFSLVNHFGSLLVDELMNKIKYMVHVEKRDYVLLDHINMLTAGSGSADERRELDTIMEKLSAFVASNDFGLICVAHINREASKVRPPAGKEDQPYWVKVKATDLRGTAGLEQMSWNIIGLESEWLPDRTRGRIRTVVLKNREASELGEGDILRMNPTTGLLEDAADKNEAEF